MVGHMFYSAIPGWIQVLAVLVSLGCMIAVAVAAVVAARCYARQVDFEIAKEAAFKSDGALWSEAASASDTASSQSAISVELFVD